MIATLTLAAALLGAGTLVSLVGVTTHLPALALVGTLVAGVGFGAAALATFGTFARIAAPHERGGLLAFALTIAYLSFSLPAVVAGFASTAFGLRTTAEVYALVIVGLTAVALVMRLSRVRAERTRVLA